MSGGAAPAPADAPRLFVTVGTDHHPFARLLDWVGRWSAAHGRWRVDVQYGASPAPAYGHAFAFCGHEEMRAHLRSASVVVTHAGPATITQARAMGFVPVVVPRDPALREHVDDHQILFARRLAAGGLVWLAESEAGLERAISAALAVAAAGPPPAAPSGVPPGVYRVAEVVEQLVDGRREQDSDQAARSPRHRVARSRLRH